MPQAVVNIRPPEPGKKKPPPILDPVFFHKSQVALGTVLTYMGRTDPGTEWRVEEIVSLLRSGQDRRGPYRRTSVKEIHHLSDTLILRHRGKVRKCSFGYLSYSAIWRVQGRRRA